MSGECVRPEPVPGWLEGEAGLPIRFLNAWLNAGHYCDLPSIASEHKVSIHEKRVLYNGTLQEIAAFINREPPLLVSETRMLDSRDETIGAIVTTFFDVPTHVSWRTVFMRAHRPPKGLQPMKPSKQTATWRRNRSSRQRRRSCRRRR